METTRKEKPQYRRASQLYADERYHNDETATTNWPFKNQTERKRKSIQTPKYFVDNDEGITVASFGDNVKAAAAFAKRNNLQVRLYQPNDEQLDHVNSVERRRKQIEFSGPHRPLTQTKPRKPKKIFSKN